jgi:hypothetical protein
MRHTGALRRVFAATFPPRPTMSQDNPFLHAPPAPAVPALNTHTTTEYAIDLPASWRLVPSDDGNAVTFQSDADRAGLFITVDFYEIPADKAQATADRLINSRLDRHAQEAPGRVQLFDGASRTHWQGSGHEAHCAVEIANENVVMDAVYVMSRRVLNLTLVCRRDRASALALFGAVRAHFRPVLA